MKRARDQTWGIICARFPFDFSFASFVPDSVWNLLACPFPVILAFHSLRVARPDAISLSRDLSCRVPCERTAYITKIVIISPFPACVCVCFLGLRSLLFSPFTCLLGIRAPFVLVLSLGARCCVFVWRLQPDSRDFRSLYVTMHRSGSKTRG